MQRAIKGVAKFAGAALSSLLTGLIIIGGVIAVPYLALSSPVGHFDLAAFDPPTQRTLILHDSDGRPFAERGGCVEKPVTLAEVPPHFVDALLSMEDRRFFYHFGIDPVGLARAARANRAAGRIVQGGSTLTQQLVKYSLLTSDRTLERKKKEAWLALALELRLSKGEILERYMSTAYFGEGCYGLRAAAKQYFEADVSELTLFQSAYLVGLLKSPTHFVNNPRMAEERAELVLDAMVENGKLAPEQRAEIVPARPDAKPSPSTGSYYADWVASTIHVPQTGDFSPLPVHTAFDRELHDLAEAAVNQVLEKYGEKRHASQAAMVVMRTDGRVVAMVGGRDHEESQFNRAVQARRQPGSSFKLFVYLAALRGGLKPGSAVVDRPITIGQYQPKNFGKRYRGTITVRRAFASSVNTVAVQLSEAVRRKPVIDAARDLGLTTTLEPQPSIALGAFEVTLLELTSAYAAVAAGAYPVNPWAITGFEVADKGLPPPNSGRWRLEEQKDLLTLLRSTVQNGSGRRARLPIPAYGKTGTSQDYRDAWFVGFAGNLVVGVWVGNDDFTPMKRVTGGSLPAEIWATFMRKALETDEDFERELPQIAAFQAEPRQDDRKVKLAATVIGSEDQSAPRRKARKVRRVDRFDFRPKDRPRRRGFLRGLFR